MPLVSVTIPTYNRADLLPEAVRSVLDQTARDVELIVVDDGSTDETAGLMAAFTQTDPRVRYERLPEQVGRSAARNRGAALAQGDLLGFLDSDDRYLPTALEAHQQALATEPNLGMTVGGYELIALDGARLGERRPWEEGPRQPGISDWLFNCFATPGSVLVRKHWFQQVGGFEPGRERAEDYHLFLKLAAAGCSMGWVKQSVLQYRRHAGSTVASITPMYAAMLQTLSDIHASAPLSAEARALDEQARAHVSVSYARKYLAAGQDTEARAALTTAFQLNPALPTQHKLRLIEILLSGSGDDDQVSAENLAERLRPVLNIRPAEVRRALARRAMAGFFRLRGPAPREARAFLWRGIRLDPRWLANRGVIGFIVRQGLGGRAGSS